MEIQNRSSGLHFFTGFQSTKYISIGKPQTMHWFIFSTACERNILRMTPQMSPDIVIQQLHCYSVVKQIMYKTRIVVPANTDIFHVPSLIISCDFLNISMTMITLRRKLLTRASQYRQHKGDTTKTCNIYLLPHPPTLNYLMN
jgi:hypothetical protein